MLLIHLRFNFSTRARGMWAADHLQINVVRGAWAANNKGLNSLNPKNGSTRSRILTYVRVYVHRDRWTVGTDGRGWGLGLPMINRVSLWGCL